ncbi:type VII secretion protein EssC [Weissella muntiaci]|uniref:Type VII secretion protein EssC n=1 Tax=Weissella muntiaci TaxID=2508881 RepID=A0A6C2C2Q7_9LACO|nr:type VII secretion protein EssC [Weissella muntiaci]TYC48224.1 type VII secretion protein EssC [Weissella muntiaci]
MAWKSNESDAFPDVANIDDQILSKTDVKLDVFYLSDRFEHGEISQTKPTYQLRNNNVIDIDGQILASEAPLNNSLLIKAHSELETIVTNLPGQTMTVSSDESATVRTASGNSMAVISMDEQGLTFSVYGRGGDLFVNDQRVPVLTGAFTVGTRLLLNGVLIERAEEQLKITGIWNEYDLDETVLRKAKFEPTYPVEFPDYRRSPRIIYTKPTNEIALALPEAEQPAQKGELMRTILPPLGMFAMSGLMAVMSGRNPLLSLGMGGAGIFTAGLTTSSYFKNKKLDKGAKEERLDRYQHYLLQKSVELKDVAETQRHAEAYQYPDMGELTQLIEHYDSRIYEKTADNSDYLNFSLGKGTVDASYKVDFKLEGDPKDDLERSALDLAVHYRQLADMPISTTLRNQTLGLVGVYPILKNAVTTTLLQIATFHSYRDVQFIALVPEQSYDDDWAEWRWLPHFQMQELNLRGIIHNAQSRDMVLGSFYQLLNKRRQLVREAGRDLPQFAVQYVLVILDSSWLAGHGLNEFLAEDMNQYGVSVIWGKEDRAMLPETVTTMIEYTSNASAELVTEDQKLREINFKPLQLPKDVTISDLTTRLANLKHVEVEKNAIPTAVTFLDMYNVKRIEELNIVNRWHKADTSKSLAVPLGLRGKDDVVDLNLHERAHGPHGLVAGTTGSGKSETLQSYILSLAVNFAPEDVGFLPIDFKGGGMVNLFQNLPHLMGAITNLDGAASARALASIRAESQKRQAMFNQYGVNNITKYAKLYKKGKGISNDDPDKAKYPTEPIPHLFLISDEFAELKANEPDFMAELVSVARIGRSLGIHLILATQKPSGVVDDQIWSNSRFKLALKVQDVQDSQEILKTPDAASIVEPGRAYLQVGNNEIYELFQSAWSGATYDPEAVVEEKVDERIWLVNDLGQRQLVATDMDEDDAQADAVALNKAEQVSQLEAVVDYIAELAKENAAVIPEKPWLPPLGEHIVTPVADFESNWADGERRLAVPFGVMDLPAKQAQEVLNFDLEEMGHTAIFGSAGYGKTIALQTIIMNLARVNTPEQVQFNLLDFGTNGLFPVKNLPHVADLARLDEEEKVVKFAKRIRETLDERKAAFAQAGVASLSQYESKTGQQMPVIVTVVDAYDALRESDLEDGLEPIFNQLLREGANVGMYFITAALRENTFKISMMSNMPNLLVYYLVDDTSARSLIGNDAILQQEIIGRAQIKLDEPVGYQTYLSAEGEADLDRMHAMETEIKAMEAMWSGDRPMAVPMLPAELSIADFYALPAVEKQLELGNLPMGMDVETTEIVGYQPEKDDFFLIVNETPTQAELLTPVIVEDLARLQNQKNTEVYIFDAADQFAEDDARFTQVLKEDKFAEVLPNLAMTVDNRIMQAEGNTPAIWYFPSWKEFTMKTMPSEAFFSKIIKHVRESNIHLIIQAEKSALDFDMNEASNYLKQIVRSGLVGSKLNDQKYVKVKTSFNEPEVPEDQTNYFDGRHASRIKIPGGEL